MRVSDCRFLRAREFDIEKSKELYCKYIEKVSLSPSTETEVGLPLG